MIKKILLACITTATLILGDINESGARINSNRQDAVISSDKGDINFPVLTGIRVSKDYLYFIGSGVGNILKIRKDQPDKIADTIKIFSPQLKKEILRKYYNSKGDEYFDLFERESKKIGIPSRSSVVDLQVSGDSLYALVTTNAMSITIAEDTNIGIKNIPALITLYKNKIVSVVPINFSSAYNPQNATKDQPYHLIPVSFFKQGSSFYVSVIRDANLDDNVMFAKTKIQDGKMVIDKLLPYSMPKYLLQSKIGYMMSEKIFHDGYVSNVYSNQFYDLNSGKIIDVALGATANSFTAEQATELTLKVNFQIIDFAVRKDMLDIIYQNNGSLWYARQSLKDKSSIIISKIAETYPNVKFTRAIACDNDGIYNYDYENRTMRFYPFSTL